ncbi:MAG: ATP-binding protein [Pseudomonadota bacterium]
MPENNTVIDPDVATLLDALGTAIFVLGPDREIVDLNQAGAQSFDGAEIGQDFVRVVRNPDCLAAIDQVYGGEAQARTEFTHSLQPLTFFRVTVCRLKDQDNAARVAICLEDVSQIRDAEKIRSEFVANVSHELRSPLTSLAGFVETLKGPARNDAAAQTRFLNFMENEAQRMTRLIGDLLSLSKVQDRARIRPDGRVDMHAVVQQVLETLNVEAQKERKKLHVSPSPNIRPIQGDEDELTQVIRNLIENAIKYGAADTDIVISLDKVERVRGIAGPALAVSVEDQGPGIPAEEIPRLTERFYRVDKSRSRDKGGTGLGLAIVKHILNRHRGRLLIESQEGQGSKFTVYLPTSLAP